MNVNKSKVTYCLIEEDQSELNILHYEEYNTLGLIFIQLRPDHCTWYLSGSETRCRKEISNTISTWPAHSHQNIIIS